MTEQRRVFGSQTYCNYTIEEKQALAVKVKEFKQAYDNNLEELKGKTHWDVKCMFLLYLILLLSCCTKKSFVCNKKQAASLKPIYVPLLDFPPLPLNNF